MRTRILITTASLLALGLAGLAGQASAAPTQPGTRTVSTTATSGATGASRAHRVDGLKGASSQAPVYTKRACGVTAAVGQAECLALLRTTKAGTPLPAAASSASALPQGYGPTQLQSAYELAAAAAAQGSGQTVALVDAYDDPDAA